MQNLEEKLFFLQRLTNEKKKEITTKAKSMNYDFLGSLRNFEENPEETLVALIGELFSRTEYDNIKDATARINLFNVWRDYCNKEFTKHNYNSKSVHVMEKYQDLQRIAWKIYCIYGMPSPKKQLEKEWKEKKKISISDLSNKEIKHIINSLPPYAKEILEEETGKKYGSIF